MKVSMVFVGKYEKPQHVSVILESPGEITRFIEVLGEKNLNLSTMLGRLGNVRGYKDADTILEDLPQ